MKVSLLGTGGTIASRSRVSGRSPAVGVAELHRSALEVMSTAPEVSCRDLGLRSSAEIGFDDIAELAHAVSAAEDGDADAVVITHGTDTLEETAFALALTHDGGIPVVVTGAQRPFDDPCPDGPRNLAQALEWSVHPSARDTGVTVTFDGAILSAVGVRKVDTMATSAFAAPGRAALGRAGEAGIHVYARPVRPTALLKPDELTELPAVSVVPMYLACGTSALETAVSSGARGIVLAAFGAGNATRNIAELVGELVADGVPVVVASRVGSGPTAGLYGGGGGGADLERAGAVFAGDLSPWQARLVLAAAMVRASRTRNAAEWVRHWLAT